MFDDLIKFPIEHERLRWQAKEVVKDLDLKPHLFVRLTLTGARFPVMAQLPVVRVGNVRSHHVIISEDQLTAHAYFRQELPARGTIAFGFGDAVLLRFRPSFAARQLRRLDRKRLPKGIELFGGGNQGRAGQGKDEG